MLYRLFLYNKEEIMLDIIIPTYNDCDGLRRSLNSILWEDWIHITVINDQSSDDYSWLKEEFPTIQYLEMGKNSGPGAARNFARKHTSAPFILFLDCGDIIYSKYLFYEIKDIIEKNPSYYVYGWSWIDIEDGHLRKESDPSTPGKVYSRKFLEDHQLWQCEGLGSYAGEDMSFNRAIQAIIEDLEDKDEIEYKYYSPIPIYSVITNLNSITHKNNFEFRYKQTPGFIENIAHCAKLLQINNVTMDKQLVIITDMMVLLYHQFLLGLNEDKKFVSHYWSKIQDLYFNCYHYYENFHHENEYLSMAQRRHMKGLAYVNKTGRLPNIHRFLEEVKSNETIPQSYIGG